MENKTYLTITAVLLLLGLVHIGFTPVFFSEFNLAALWFAGTGLSFIFLGLINLFNIRSKDFTVKKLTLAGNLLGLIFSGFLLVFLHSELQAYVALVVLLFISLRSLVELIRAKPGY